MKHTKQRIPRIACFPATIQIDWEKELFSTNEAHGLFENGGFTLKTHQMLSVTPGKFKIQSFPGFRSAETTSLIPLVVRPLFRSTALTESLGQAKFKNASINGHFGFVFEENSGREYYGYRNVIVFEKHRFQNVFVHTKTQSAIRRFQIPPV